jgi:hypothetical protein
MNGLRKLLVSVVILGIMSVFVIPTFAQGNTAPVAPTQVSVSFSADQINTWISKHHSHRVSSLIASLGTNELTVSYKLTKAKVVSDLIAVLSPKISKSKVSWILDSLTVNGVAASKTQLADYGKGITSLISNYLKATRSRYSLTNVSIDGAAVNFTLTHK